MSTMRAKLKVTSVEKSQGCERLKFAAVYKDGAYPEGGADEDNTFAMYTPQADLSMAITNPALLGQLEVGQAYYVDFTPV